MTIDCVTSLQPMYSRRPSRARLMTPITLRKYRMSSVLDGSSSATVQCLRTEVGRAFQRTGAYRQRYNEHRFRPCAESHTDTLITKANYMPIRSDASRAPSTIPSHDCLVESGRASSPNDRSNPACIQACLLPNKQRQYSNVAVTRRRPASAWQQVNRVV